MGFRFRKSFKIAPGVRINLSKSGISTSIGPTGAKLNIGPKGVRATASIPGTGLSYSEKISPTSATSSAMSECPYCGHKMRKQWDSCPECHNQLVTYEENEALDASCIDPEYTDPTSQEAVNMTLEVKGTRLIITNQNIIMQKKGVLGFLLHGSSPDKVIPIKSINSISVRKANLMFNGCIYFEVCGNKTSKILSMAKSENTIIFSGKDNNEIAEQIKIFVESVIKSNRTIKRIH